MNFITTLNPKRKEHPHGKIQVFLHRDRGTGNGLRSGVRGGRADQDEPQRHLRGHQLSHPGGHGVCRAGEKIYRGLGGDHCPSRRQPGIQRAGAAQGGQGRPGPHVRHPHGGGGRQRPRVRDQLPAPAGSQF